MKQTKLKTIFICITIAATIVASAAASATMIDITWSGVFTVLDSNGAAVVNSSATANSWLGNRTDITGTMAIDLSTGGGAGTVTPFTLSGNQASFSGLAFQAIGDGFGNPGTLAFGNMIFNWDNAAIPVSLVWDFAGLYTTLQNNSTLPVTIIGQGAVPASNGIDQGNLPIGPAPMATTTWNTTTVCAPLNVGPFAGDSINIDITSMQVSAYMGWDPAHATPTPTNCVPSGGFPLIADTIGGSPIIAAVPVPAAVWLFSSGLLGFFGFMQRRMA